MANAFEQLIRLGNALNVAGDMLVANSLGQAARLSIGTDGQMLAIAAGAPTWASGFLGASYTFTNSDFLIAADTADGADSKRISICGGGSNSSSRGAYALFHGNEHANTGDLSLATGNNASAEMTIGSQTFIALQSGGFSTRWSLEADGDFAGDATNGGDLILNRAGKGFKVKEGSNARMGVATLVAGTIAVSNTSVTANTRIFFNRSTTGGTVGHLSYTISAGVSFTINSSSGTDTSTVVWHLIEPS